MDLGDLKYLDAPAKVLKLSEAIITGRQFVEENTTYYGCSLCAAFYARTGENLGKAEGGGSHYLDRFMRAFPEVPRLIAHTVSTMHYSGRSDADCAEFAKSQGH